MSRHTGAQGRSKALAAIAPNKTLEAQYYAQRVKEAAERRAAAAAKTGKRRTTEETLLVVATLLRAGASNSELHRKGYSAHVVDLAAGEMDLGRLGGWTR